MSGFKIQISDPTGEVVSMLESSAAKVSSWHEFFKSWQTAWYRSRKQMFNTQGQETDTPWPVYTVAERQYAAMKSEMFGRPLNKFDVLRWLDGNERLFPSMVGPSDAESIRLQQGSTLVVGTRVPYAVNHHYGRGTAPEEYGSYTIPRRPLIALGKRLLKTTSALMSEHVVASVRNPRHRKITTRSSSLAGLPRIGGRMP